MKYIPIIIILGSFLFPDNVDHLLLTRVVTQGGPALSPNAAESFSIYNPTDSQINLSNYYVCDDADYYKMQTDGDMASSSIASGFTARFPAINIESGDTLNIVLNENYTEFYEESFIPDIIMFGAEINSMIETENGSFGFADSKLNESSELLILFYWDGNSESLIQDVDYFVWSSLGGISEVVDKTGIGDYLDDTTLNSQLYFEKSTDNYYAYSRIGIEEVDEIETGGNGIIGHDETSENFRESWEIIKLFTEVIIAPKISTEAKKIFKRKKNIRILETGGIPNSPNMQLQIKSLSGGLLIQDVDNGKVKRVSIKTVTKRKPSKGEMDDLLFAFTVCKHVKSNAIVYAKNKVTVGIGAGQMSRIDSAKIAVLKSEEAKNLANEKVAKTKDCVVASDAFFPFPDALLEIIKAGAKAVIQPGGSIKDKEVIKAANANKTTMVFTGMRHFRH